jgi:hypothetical protein
MNATISTGSPAARLRPKGLPLSVAALFLVAATSAFVILQYRWTQSVQWSQAQVSQPRYRGADGADREPVYTAEQLALLAALLQQGISDQYKTLAPKRAGLFKKKTEWTMSTHIQELFDGALGIEVEGRAARDGDVAARWSQEFSSIGEFHEGVSALAQRVATDMAARRRAP